MTTAVKTELILEGLGCAHCAAMIEEEVNKIDGISATMNFMTKTLTVEIVDSYEFNDDLLQKITKLSLLQNNKESLSAIESSIKKGETYLQKLESNLTVMAKEYSQILERFSICPTCLKPIDKKTTQKIVSELLY